MSVKRFVLKNLPSSCASSGRTRTSIWKSDKNGQDQGDQMSLWKNRPKCNPTNFLVKINK
jgi:hypothetical protein